MFVVSSIAKLARPRLWHEQAVELVNAPAAVIAAWPVVEAVLGALLIVQFDRRVMALLAVAVLALFTAVLVRRISQGRRPRCACFGSFGNTPIGWGHVARNTSLIAVALLAAFA